jgi:hypothetical protein
LINPDEDVQCKEDTPMVTLFLKDLIVLVLKKFPNQEATADKILEEMMTIHGPDKVYNLGYKPIEAESKDKT